MEEKGETLGTRLGILIKFLGLSKGDFAEKADISQSLVSNILSGKNGPSNSTLNLICCTYNVNKNWLRTGEGDMLIEKPEPAPQKEPIIGPDGETLKGDEAELVGIYRELEEPNQKKVLTYAHDIQDAQKQQAETVPEKGEAPGIGPGGNSGKIG